MKKLRIGVVGIGDIANKYLDNLQRYSDVVELYGCTCRHLDRSQKKAAEYGMQKAYASPEELIADPAIDLVLNLTIPEVHAKYNLLALEHGKHVYTEKPLAATFAEGREIMRLAGEKGLYVGCAPDTFLGSRLQTCRELLDAGKIGRVMSGGAYMVCHGHETFHGSVEFYYQPGGGPLLDLGPYYLHALFSLLGPVRRVCAMANRAYETRPVTSVQPQPIAVNVDTHVSGTLEFACGALVTMVMSFDVHDSALPRIELYGTAGTLTMRDPDPLSGPNLFGGPIELRTHDFRWIDDPRRPGEEDEPWEQAEVTRPFSSVSHARNHRGLGLIDMVYALAENRAARASGDMALHALDVMEGMLVSAHEGRFVDMQTTFAQPAPLPLDFPQGKD